MTRFSQSFVLFLGLLVACCSAFSALPSPGISTRTIINSNHVNGKFALKSTAESTDLATTSKGLLKRDRYVATNRFAVRPGKAGKFEQRWANRKSRLATLDGFKYFHLMRRVTLDEESDKNTYDEGNAAEDTLQGNYVSFTVWEKKSDFSAWRSGEAFKEAHGGTRYDFERLSCCLCEKKSNRKIKTT